MHVIYSPSTRLAETFCESRGVEVGLCFGLIVKTSRNNSTKSGLLETMLDIGGSYPENESRLSDITLSWMVDFITKEIPPDRQVIADPDFLKLYPSSDGMMHDECMVGVGGTSIPWHVAIRDVPDTAKLHDTVYERLRMTKVRNFTSYGPYRPAALRNHGKARDFFGPEVQQPQVRIPRSQDGS